MDKFSLIVAVLASALVLVCGSPISQDSVADSQELGVAPHLIGGSKVGILKREYYVGFTFYNGANKPFYCGGIRLNEKWMITAAECLDKTRSKSVRITTVHNHAMLQGEYRQTSELQFTVHPKYDPKTKANNIALLRSTDESWNLAFLHPKLPAKSEDYSKHLDQRAFVTGHNITKDRLSHSEITHMLSITVDIKEPVACKGWYDPNVPIADTLCTIPWYDEGVDERDIGAPLIMHGFRDETLIAMVMKVHPKSVKRQPVVFTKISPYLDWIGKVTGIKIQN